MNLTELQSIQQSSKSIGGSLKDIGNIKKIKKYKKAGKWLAENGGATEDNLMAASKLFDLDSEEVKELYVLEQTFLGKKAEFNFNMWLDSPMSAKSREAYSSQSGRDLPEGMSYRQAGALMGKLELKKEVRKEPETKQFYDTDTEQYVEYIIKPGESTPSNLINANVQLAKEREAGKIERWYKDGNLIKVKRGDTVPEGAISEAEYLKGKGTGGKGGGKSEKSTLMKEIRTRVDNEFKTYQRSLLGTDEFGRLMGEPNLVLAEQSKTRLLTLVKHYITPEKEGGLGGNIKNLGIDNIKVIEDLYTEDTGEEESINKIIDNRSWWEKYAPAGLGGKEIPTAEDEMLGAPNEEHTTQKFNSPEEVKNAYKSGEITKQEAVEEIKKLKK
ncbi:MAG: hypothetical protein U9O94_03290 [Nanoarchaeota archaeon]|nr:hypothetical protein [Nanoarchaeota archaeon]